MKKRRTLKEKEKEIHRMSANAWIGHKVYASDTVNEAVSDFLGTCKRAREDGLVIEQIDNVERVFKDIFGDFEEVKD